MPAEPQPTIQPEPLRAIIGRLIDAGMQIVDETVALAKTPAPSETKAQLVAAASAAYDRVARAVRRAVLLAEHLDNAVGRAQKRTAARKRILREVEDRIQHEEKRPQSRECLRAELLERLDTIDILEEIDSRPVEDIITDIVRDLRVDSRLSSSTPWQRRTPDDVALLCARAASPPGTLRPYPNPPPDPAPNDPPPTTAQLERFFHQVIAPRLE